MVPIILIFIYIFVFVWVASYLTRDHYDSLFPSNYENEYGTMVNMYSELKKYTGGAFDLRKFLLGLHNKYTTNDGHIEVEIHFKQPDLYDKIKKWILARPHYVAENTINKYRRSTSEKFKDTNIIEVIKEGNPSMWNTKKRLSAAKHQIGKLTISLENILNKAPQNIEAVPYMVRHKKRISENISDNWRVDFTEVSQISSKIEEDTLNADTIEVEFEYIANDYWKALDKADEITKFIDSL